MRPNTPNASPTLKRAVLSIFNVAFHSSEREFQLLLALQHLSLPMLIHLPLVCPARSVLVRVSFCVAQSFAS